MSITTTYPGLDVEFDHPHTGRVETGIVIEIADGVATVRTGLGVEHAIPAGDLFEPVVYAVAI